MEFMLNVPATVILLKNFKNGQGQFGPWFGWNVRHQGVEKTMFADQGLQSFLSTYGPNSEVVITRSQIQGTNSSVWGVQPARQATPADPGTTPYPPMPPATTSLVAQNGHSNRESYRTERVDRAKEAFTDAEKVLDPSAWGREDVRALAISFLIDEERKKIPAPDELGF